MKNQGGFTLIEIAIVLVIIGLLLGGVLKGQELINQAKIKNIANDLNGIGAAIYAYQDRYKSYPGDDKGATRWATTGLVSAATSGANQAGNGQIGGDFNSITDTDESRLFWRHLRYAGLIAGDATSGVQPQNAVGGLLGIQYNAGIPADTTATPAVAADGLTGLITCQSNLLGKLAEAIDNQLDDGKPKTGSLKAWEQTAGALAPGATNPTSTTTAVATATAYKDDGTTLYTVCKQL
jgi:prepilin-type N-terminal cleavage/methylation domain-containing protein